MHWGHAVFWGLGSCYMTTTARQHTVALYQQYSTRTCMSAGSTYKLLTHNTMLRHWRQQQHASACQQSGQTMHIASPACFTAARCLSLHPLLSSCSVPSSHTYRRNLTLKVQPERSGNEELDHPLQPQPTTLPTLWDGVNWYCYTALGLLFLTDFTPIGHIHFHVPPAWLSAGQWLLAGSGAGSAAGRLAVLQWAVFVLPSLWWMHTRGWDLKSVLKVESFGTAQQLLAGLAAGPALWLLINLALALKTGNVDALLGAASAAAGSGSSSSTGLLLLGGGAGGGLMQLPQLLLAAAVSPAVAEEVLFRGFLLTALQERLGRVDAVAVCAALFALIHLDPQQFFLYCVLGGASGAAAVASGSLGPAVALHLGFNAAAVTAGLLLHR